jgi:uncharacterized membrane protein
MVIWEQILRIFFISMLPIGELRVSIPLAIAAYHWSYPLAFLIGVLGNLVFIYPLTWLLDTILLKWVENNWFGYRILEKILTRAQNKTKEVYQRWAKWGLMAFVAIPLPLTGAWTGTVGARLLGLSRRDTFFYVGLGVIVAGLIVTLATFLVTKGVHIFFI